MFWIVHTLSHQSIRLLSLLGTELYVKLSIENDPFVKQKISSDLQELIFMQENLAQ
jgi:hypothetical protein